MTAWQLVYFIFMCILTSLTLTVDGRNRANQLISKIYHYLQGFIHPSWWSPDFWTINLDCTWIPSHRCWHWCRFHRGHRDCQAICSWISCPFEDSPSHKFLMPWYWREDELHKSNFSGVIKWHPFWGGSWSNSANQWWFWEIALIIMRCLGWCHVITPDTPIGKPWFRSWFWICEATFFLK